MNELDQLLTSYKAGDTPRLDMLMRLMELHIILPSAGEIDAEGAGYEPLVFDRLGTHMIAACSNSKLAAKYKASHPHTRFINTLGFIKLLKPEYGLVINPGEPTSLELIPDMLDKVRKQMGAF